MSKKSATPSKKKATSKAKTGTTSQKKSSTQSKRTTSQTFDWAEIFMSNSKDTSRGKIEERWNQFVNLTRDSTFELSLYGTTLSGEVVSYGIRVGPNGLEYRGQLDEEYRKIG